MTEKPLSKTDIVKELYKIYHSGQYRTKDDMINGIADFILALPSKGMVEKENKFNNSNMEAMSEYYESKECQEWMDAPMGKTKEGSVKKEMPCTDKWHTQPYEQYAKEHGGLYPRSCPSCHSCFNPAPKEVLEKEAISKILYDEITNEKVDRMIKDISIHGQYISKDGERIDPKDMYKDAPKEGSIPEPGETPNDIAWQQGYKAGVAYYRLKEGSSADEINELFLEKARHVTGGRGFTDKWLIDKNDWNAIMAKLSSSNQLAPLDKDMLFQYYCREFRNSDIEESEEFQRFRQLAKDFCSKFGTPKPKAWEARIFPPAKSELVLLDENKIREAIKRIVDTDNWNDEDLVWEIMKFGVPKPVVPSVEEIEKVILNTYRTSDMSFNKVAIAIHNLLSGKDKS